MSELTTTFQDELENKLVELLTSVYDVKRNVVQQLIRIAKRDLDIIKESYESLSENKDIRNDEFEITINGNDYSTLKIKEEEQQLLTVDLLRIFVYLIDVVSPVYALGSVVALKKEYVKKLLHGKTIDKAYFVITKRFIYKEDSTVYFSYAGTPYPVGNLGLQNDFYFTDNLIEKVVHHGYEDDQEAVFVYMMKRELILEKKYKSIGYASEDERNALIKEEQ